MRKPQFSLRKLSLVVGLALAAYGLVLALWRESLAPDLLRGLLSWTSLQAAMLCVLSYLLRGLRWRRWMAACGRQLGLSDGLRLYVAGYALTPTPGNVGEAARGLWLAERPLDTGQALAVFGAERLADLLALLLMATPVLVWGLQHGGTLIGLRSPGGAVIALGLAFLLVAGVLCGWLLRQYARSHVDKFLAWSRDAWTFLADRPLGWMGLTLGAWFAQGLGVWLLCQQAGVPTSFLMAAGGYALAMVAGALSALPAGLGGTEAVLAGLLVGQGAAPGAAIAVTVLARLLTLWLAVGLGVAALLYSAAIRKDIRLF